MGPFRISVKIGVVSYLFELPALLASVHNMFHVSMLRKHLRDEEQQRVTDVSDL